MTDPHGFLALALSVLGQRLITLLALLMTFGLFAWSMWMQSTLSCIIASLFGGLIFLPVLFAGRPPRQQEPSHGEDE